MDIKILNIYSVYLKDIFFNHLGSIRGIPKILVPKVISQINHHLEVRSWILDI